MEAMIYLLFIVVGFIMGRMTVRNTSDKVNTPIEIKMPNLNPVKAYEEHKAKKKEKKEQDKLEVILSNAMKFDGTGIGQENVPM